MPTPQQAAQIAAIFDAAPDLTLAFLGADGRPVAVTLAFAHDGLSLYFGTSSGSQKVADLARDARVSLTVNKPYAHWDEIEGLRIEGRAQRVTEPNEFLKAGKLLFAKYPEAAKLPAPAGAETALFRIDPEQILLLDYAKGHGFHERVTL